LCAVRALADSLNFLRIAIAEEASVPPPAIINPYDLLDLLFTGPDLESSNSIDGPIGHPTKAFRLWIYERLEGLHNLDNMVQFNVQRRELLRMNNLSLHQMDAILSLMQEEVGLERR
jgi:hypothetical protein